MCNESGVWLAVCFILFWINIGVLVGLKKKAAVQKQEDVKFTVTDILQKVNTLIQFVAFMSQRPLLEPNSDPMRLYVYTY